MKRTAFRILPLLLALLFVACAGMQPAEPPLTFSPASFDAARYEPKVDNFQFILDASYSMDGAGQRDLLTARNLVAAINQSLPTALDFSAGLRTFGHSPKQSKKKTELVYGMTNYSRSGLGSGLEEVRHAGGNSPLPEAISAAGADLKAGGGKSAVIIVSDGQVELEMEGAKAAAARLKDERGANLCIYTVAVGAEAAGQQFLRDVAQAAGCGSSTTAAALTNPSALASFVEQIFLERKSTPSAPPPADSDGDGVTDNLDKCPNTPPGRIVDEDGCTLKLTLHLNFDFDKAQIKPEFRPDLERAATFIKRNKKVPYILIEGHTDSVGDAVYNQQLSERRAEAVKQALVQNHGVAADRLIVRGMGESTPVADNSTDAGRAENRRVEIICCAIRPNL